MRERALANKFKVMNHYSNPQFNGIIECNGFDGVKCPWNCSDIDVLTIDHINDDGADQRRKLYGGRTGGGSRFYKWLIKNNFPEGYQVLCCNCQRKKEMERLRGDF
jgi:hypothetical protein